MADDISADVLVVLGAALLGDGGPPRAMARRVRHAARLHAAGRGRVVVMSGGRTRRKGLPAAPPDPESRVMRRLAVAAGVPDACIVEEDRSTRTLENALEVRALMVREGWRRAIVVTDGFHLPRALMTFRVAGVRCTGAAAPGAWHDEGTSGLLAAVLREAGAMLWYVILVALGRLRPL